MFGLILRKFAVLVFGSSAQRDYIAQLEARVLEMEEVIDHLHERNVELDHGLLEAEQVRDDYHSRYNGAMADVEGAVREIISLHERLDFYEKDSGCERCGGGECQVS